MSEDSARRRIPLGQWLSAFTLAWAVLCLSASARAQDWEYDRNASEGRTSRPYWPVSVTSAAFGKNIEIYQPEAKPGRDWPLLVCGRSCRVALPAGEYRVSVVDAQGRSRASRALAVNGPASWLVRPPSEEQRTTGLVLGVAGPVAMVGGSMLILSGLCIEECRDSHADRVAAGLILAIGGVVATPIGWVMFGKSFRPTVEVSSGAWRTARALNTKEERASVRGGVLGLSVAF